MTLAENGETFVLDHGAVAIAAITSCTNTSNPSVMLAAGLLARNAAKKGLKAKPWVKTTLAPGSKVVTDYYEKAGLTHDLEALGFYTVGYGCTTCIGNSGPLLDEISQAVNDNDLAVTAVLSGNRNFEGRINPDVKMNYLASPPLVIAYALAGSMNFDFEVDPLGTDSEGNDVFLKDIWPDAAEVQETIDSSINEGMFVHQYASVFEGDERWKSLPTPTGSIFEWDAEVDLRAQAPVLRGHDARDHPGHRHRRRPRAREARRLGHHRPHLARRLDQGGEPRRPVPDRARHRPQGLQLLRLAPRQPRGHDPRDVREHPPQEPAARRQSRAATPATSPSRTRPQAFIYDASQNYQAQGTPLVILGGKEYGSGSSRDWAAKGTSLLGVRAVITESFERIHRSNLIGMGVVPLQFPAGETADSLGLDGTEVFSITGLEALNEGTTPKTVHVIADAERALARGQADGRVRRGGPHRHPR